jgi:hypothetical protein
MAYDYQGRFFKAHANDFEQIEYEKFEHATWEGKVTTMITVDEKYILQLQKQAKDLEEQVQIAREYQRAIDVQYLEYVGLRTSAAALKESKL